PVDDLVAPLAQFPPVGRERERLLIPREAEEQEAANLALGRLVGDGLPRLGELFGREPGLRHVRLVRELLEELEIRREARERLALEPLTRAIAPESTRILISPDAEQAYSKRATSREACDALGDSCSSGYGRDSSRRRM